jgi:hypothetical protein
MQARVAKNPLRDGRRAAKMDGNPIDLQGLKKNKKSRKRGHQAGIKAGKRGGLQMCHPVRKANTTETQEPKTGRL